MSAEYAICTNSYNLGHQEFDKNDSRPNEKIRTSMHGKVKIYTKQEVKDFNEERGLI